MSLVYQDCDKMAIRLSECAISLQWGKLAVRCNLFKVKVFNRDKFANMLSSVCGKSGEST